MSPSTSAHREAEARWFQGLLRQRIATGLTLAPCGTNAWRLTVEGSDEAVTISGGDLRSDPANPSMTHWDPAVEGFRGPLGLPLPAPGLAAPPSPFWAPTDTGATMGYDIPGLALWMLSRAEEVGRTDLDAHGRFPATASHAFRHGYLERPLVDEWMEILAQAVVRTWPGLARPPRPAGMRVSHDVDAPSRYAFGSPTSLVRAMGSDLLRRRDLAGFLLAPRIRWGSRQLLSGDDPSNTFDWIMDQSDRHGLTSAFYFICGRTDARRDAAYDPEDRRIRALMRHIHARGHEIGLHPSYGTYRDPEALSGEAARLRRICAEEGISQGEWGGRMHFLRWETPTTLRAWDSAGMDYDSSLSYADLPGFRCGTCFEYAAFDSVASRPLNLRIRPLVAMECTVMAPRYLGLGSGQAALDKFVSLKKACEAVGGTFTTLWHNTYLESRDHRDLYQKLLAA